MGGEKHKFEMESDQMNDFLLTVAREQQKRD